MFRKNDFEKLCDQLENCNEKCESNPIKLFVQDIM